ATIVAILVIASIVLYSNQTFTKSQNELINHVLPMENASRQLNNAVVAFITYQQQVTTIDPVNNTVELTPRNQLEAKFEKYLAQLKKAVSDNKHNAMEVQPLLDDYQRFLV